MKITAQTRIAGVVGNPVRHSLSPIIHNAWIEAAGLDAVYLAFEPPKDRFREFIDGLRGGVVRGLNVTIPFKEEALALADEADEAARTSGAANVLFFHEDGRALGWNTDGQGLHLSLQAAGAFFKNPEVSVFSGVERSPIDRAVIMGAGGAARGAAAALLKAGVRRIEIINRTIARAEAVAATMPGVIARHWGDAATSLAEAEVLINATSLGMIGQPPLELDLAPLPKSAIVMDMVYRPLLTPLLRQARDRGNRTADGLTMLIEQASLSYFGIFGRAPLHSVDVRTLCLEALGEES